MSPFQKCWRISMQVYRLETARRELSRVTPRVVPVIRLPGFEESVQWWPRRQAQRRARAAGDEPYVASGDEDAPIALEDAAAAAEPPEEEEDEGEEPEPLVHILGPLEMLLDRYEEPAPEVVPADPAVEAEAPELEPAPGAAVAAAGLAAVAGVPPPPEPVGDLPDRVVAFRPRARGRGAPDAVIQIPEGKIAFYVSNGDFTAYCARHEDERCTLSRARRAGAAGTAREMAGIPICLIMAWLKVCDACDDKTAHKEKEVLRDVAGPGTLEWRSELRASVAELEGGAALLSFEGRDPKPGEGPEPATVI